MILDKLNPASFRGVRFLCPHGSAEEGRHGVKHEYSDSNHRYVEDNGGIPPDFKVTAIVHGTDAIAWLNRLRGALNTPGPGTLIHPLYGRQIVQVVGPFHVKHDDKDTGVITLDVHFSVTGPPIFPGQLSGIAAAIAGLAGLSLANLFSAFGADWARLLSVGVSAATLDTLAGAVTSVASSISSSFGGVAALASTASAIFRAPERLIADVALLPRALATLVSSPFEVDRPDPLVLQRSAVAVAALGHAFTERAAALPATTLDYVQRKSALTLLGAVVETAAFVSLCRALALKDYATADAVAADLKALTDAHALLSDLDLPVSVQSAAASTGADLRQQLANLMAETVAVLESEQVTLPDVMSVRVDQIPAGVLAYRLYDSDTDELTLVGLNDGTNPLLYDGAVKVLRQ